MSETIDTTDQQADNAVVQPSGLTPFKRHIGFRHRVKRRVTDGVPGEPLPSAVSILDLKTGFRSRFELETEQDELDFINGMFPVKYRVPSTEEDISTVIPWQVVWREAKEEDSLVVRHPSQCKFKERRAASSGQEKTAPELTDVAVKVPIEWVGLQEGDAMAMVLGGSGDCFAYAASKKLHSMNGEVFRLPPFVLQDCRGDGTKDDDAHLLADLLSTHFDRFYPTHVRDRGIIVVRETHRLRIDAMKDRIACVQRLRARFIGTTFCSEKGGYPQGDLEKRYASVKANDPILNAVLAQERLADKAMVEAVEATELWQHLFSPIEGVGPAISARFISAIIDIRRFSTNWKLRKYMGAHVGDDGTFPRRRSKQVGNWHPDARQALYLLSDQFNRRKDSKWGKRLRENKVMYRQRHSETCVEVNLSALGIPEEFVVSDHLGRCTLLGEYSELKFVVKKIKDADGNPRLVARLPLGPGPHSAKTKKYKLKHPLTGEEITVSGPQRYTDGHIHDMAIWRTISEFVDWLFHAWWDLERRRKARPVQPNGGTEPEQAAA